MAATGPASEQRSGSECPGSAVVRIHTEAFEQIAAELSQWAEKGRQRCGLPFEAALYPISRLHFTAESPSPLEGIDISHVGQIDLVRVAIPPDEIKDFGPSRCAFKPDRALETAFNQQISNIIGDRDELGIIGKLHSHPFASDGVPSHLDIAHHAFKPAHVNRRRKLGLTFTILHVAYPAGDSWSVGNTAVDGKGVATWLGDAVVVDDITADPPAWRTSEGQQLLESLAKSLTSDGWTIRSHGALGLGWSGLAVESPKDRRLVVALAPQPWRVRIVVRFAGGYHLAWTIAREVLEAAELHAGCIAADASDPVPKRPTA